MFLVILFKNCSFLTRVCTYLLKQKFEFFDINLIVPWFFVEDFLFFGFFYLNLVVFKNCSVEIFKSLDFSVLECNFLNSSSQTYYSVNFSEQKCTFVDFFDANLWIFSKKLCFCGFFRRKSVIFQHKIAFLNFPLFIFSHPISCQNEAPASMWRSARQALTATAAIATPAAADAALRRGPLLPPAEASGAAVVEWLSQQWHRHWHGRLPSLCLPRLRLQLLPEPREGRLAVFVVEINS